MQTVSMEQFRHALEKHEKGAVFLDVRTPQEYRTAHIPGVRNVHIDELESHLPELRKATALYVHCKTGARSGRACQMLDDWGIEQVYLMDGGLEPWERAGYPVERQ